MRVLVTGTGLVGCHTARWLVGQGDDLLMADLHPDVAYVRRVVGRDVPVEVADVRDGERMADVVASWRPAAVVHTVAVMSAVAQAAPAEAVAVNVGGTVNVAEAVRRAGVARLVHVSTLGVHDLSRPQDGPLGEDFPTGGNPRVYSATKVATEHLLRSLAAAAGFELAMLRIGATYGDGHFRGGSAVGMAVRDVLTAVLDGRQGRLGPGLAPVDELTYVEDVADGVGRAVHAGGLRFDTFNVGAGRLTSTDDLVAALERVVPGARVVRGGPPRRDANPRRQPMALDRARSELGYEPRFDLEHGLLAYRAALLDAP